MHFYEYVDVVSLVFKAILTSTLRRVKSETSVVNRKRDLGNCMLTCRLWYGLGQPLLWNTLNWDTNVPGELLKRNNRLRCA